MMAGVRLGLQDFSTDDGWEEEGLAAADAGRKERGNQVCVGAWRHQSRDQLGSGAIAARLRRRGYYGVGVTVLVVDGDDRQVLAAAGLATQGLEIGDHQLRVPFLHLPKQAGEAPRRPWGGDQVLSQCAA